MSLPPPLPFSYCCWPGHGGTQLSSWELGSDGAGYPQSRQWCWGPPALPPPPVPRCPPATPPVSAECQRSDATGQRGRHRGDTASGGCSSGGTVPAALTAKRVLPWTSSHSTGSTAATRWDLVRCDWRFLHKYSWRQCWTTASMASILLSPSSWAPPALPEVSLSQKPRLGPKANTQCPCCVPGTIQGPGRVVPEITPNHSATSTRPSEPSIIVPVFPGEEAEMERVKKMRWSLGCWQMVQISFPSVHRKVALLYVLKGGVWLWDQLRSVKHGRKCQGSIESLQTIHHIPLPCVGETLVKVQPLSSQILEWLLDSITLLTSMDTQTKGIFVPVNSWDLGWGWRESLRP